jgi:deazaflavin-dependent oxidoreductase (nitroreductase family)
MRRHPSGYVTGMANDTLAQALDSTNEIDITVIGRTSGREITLPVWFVREDDELYLVPVNASGSNWFKNVRKNPTMRVSARGADLTAQATAITDRVAVDQIVDGFRAKYGADNVAKYYPGADVAVEIPLGG